MQKIVDERVLKAVCELQEDLATGYIAQTYENEEYIIHHTLCIGFETGGIHILNPYLDETGCRTVQPCEWYGQAGEEMLNKIEKLCLACGIYKDSFTEEYSVDNIDNLHLNTEVIDKVVAELKKRRYNESNKFI